MPKPQRMFVQLGGKLVEIGAALYDYNGTIVDDTLLCFEAHCAIFDFYGKPRPDFDEWRREIELTREFRPFYLRRGINASNSEISARFLEHFHGTEPYPLATGVVDVLRTFSAAGIPQAIVSRLRGDVLERDVDANGLRRYFGVYTFGDLKEKSAKFGELRRHFGCTRESKKIALVFEDSLPGLRQARGAGCLAIAYTFGHSSPDVLALAYPDITIGSWAEFQAMLFSQSTS